MRRRATAKSRKGLRKSFVSKSNVEVKTIQHAEIVGAVTKRDGSTANGPSNSLVMITGLHGGDITNNNVPNPGIQRGTGCDHQLLGALHQRMLPTFAACMQKIQYLSGSAGA